MARFKTKAVFFILLLILFTNLAYLILFLHISKDILKAQTLEELPGIMLPAGLAVTFLAIVAAVFISSFLARGITKPISELVQATQAIARREFTQHVKIHSYPEMEELICSFNYMLGQLKNYKEETKKRRRSLERIARERAKELGYIYKIGREVSSTLELEEVLDTVVKRTSEILELKVCTILLVDELTVDRLKVSCAQGINLKRIEKEFVGRKQGVSGWVWDKKETVLIKDVDQDTRFIGRTQEKYYTGNLISIPLEAKAKIIGVLNANNKVNGEAFKQDDLLLLKEITTESAIAIENALLYKSLKEVYVHTISALAGALEAKEYYMRSHSDNVTRYAVAIAKELDLPASQIEVIRQACQLHDLGKIGIHDYILTKTGKLSSEEWDEIRMHSLRGAQILQPIGFLKEVSELVKQHHERYNGKGYPSRLKGEDIRLGARIMAVADAFDAMISERPYRKALKMPEAIAELKANSGTQFDPEIVKVFLKLLQSKPDLIRSKWISKKIY